MSTICQNPICGHTAAAHIEKTDRCAKRIFIEGPGALERCPCNKFVASETILERHLRLLKTHEAIVENCWCNPQLVVFYDCETGEPEEPGLAHNLEAKLPADLVDN
jgi:hypothetical protein